MTVASSRRPVTVTVKQNIHGEKSEAKRCAMTVESREASENRQYKG